MTACVLRLFEDAIPPSYSPIYLPAATRAIYVIDGDVTVEDATGAQLQRKDTAFVGSGEATLLAGAAGAKLYRWELVESPAPPGKLRSAPFCSSTEKLAADIELDARIQWLMRCDRVGFPKGGIAYTHVHQGPGVRCVLQGEIRIEVPGHPTHAYGPGQAWLELGHEPVLAPTTDREETEFARCFILPRACRGKSSIRYVKQEDIARPKPQRYAVLAERFIDLPAG